MFTAGKHVADDNFVLQQDSASAHRASNTVQLPQRDTSELRKGIIPHPSKTTQFPRLSLCQVMQKQQLGEVRNEPVFGRHNF